MSQRLKIWIPIAVVSLLAIGVALLLIGRGTSGGPPPLSVCSSDQLPQTVIAEWSLRAPAESSRVDNPSLIP